MAYILQYGVRSYKTTTGKNVTSIANSDRSINFYDRESIDKLFCITPVPIGVLRIHYYDQEVSAAVRMI